MYRDEKKHNMKKIHFIFSSFFFFRKITMLIRHNREKKSHKNVKVANSESIRLPRYLYRICSIAQRICTRASVICSQEICGIYVSTASDDEVSRLITLNVMLRIVHTERFSIEITISVTNQFNAGGTDRR